MSEPRRLNDLAPGHWLLFIDGRIVGCHCGVPANIAEYDYGDEIVAHIVEAAIAHTTVPLAAENARLRKSLTFLAARFLAVAPRHEGSGEAGA